MHSYDNLNFIKNVDTLHILDDIWVSDDGIIWTEVKECNKFTPRSNFKIGKLNDILVMVGGLSPHDELLKDIWVSKNGITWQLVKTQTEFKARIKFTLTNFNNALYLIGGET